MRRFSSGVTLICAVLLLLGSAPLAGAAQGQYTRQDGGGDQLVGELELSAMLLTPFDLEDEGLEGYGYRFGGTDTLDDEFTGFISTDDRPADEIQEVLEDAGFVQSRWVSMDLPSEEDPRDAARRVTVWVDEYTESGRALSDVIEIYLDFGGDDVDGTDTIGDESAIVTYTDVAPDSGVDVTAMVLAFRYENQIGQIEIVNFHSRSPEIEPSVDEIEALAERLLDRIETVRDDGGPGLEQQVLRLQSDGEQVYYDHDFYTRLDDEQLPRYGQDDDLLDELDDSEAEFGITDAYRMNQTLGWNGETGLRWSVQLRLFDDDDDAEAWVEDAEAWIETYDVDDIEIVDEEVDLGDRAMVVTYRVGTEDDDLDPHWTAIFIQVGDIGILLQLSNPGELADLDIVTELAELQVACVEDGACPIESELPDALLALMESLS